MEKKTALIIGGSSGIGEACCRLLLKNGYTVCNASRTPCPLSGVKNYTFNIDAFEDFSSLIKQIDEGFGGINVFIYSAGTSLAAPVEKISSQDFEYLFRVNYFGALEGIKAVLPYMRERAEGKIILISSIGGVVPIKYDAFYTSSKAALDALAFSLRLETERYNVYSTSVLPGGTRTGFTYKRKVYGNAFCYPYDVENAAAALCHTEQTGDNPMKVAKTVLHVINRKNPPIITAVGIKNKLYRIVAKLVPHKCLLPILQRKFNGTIS